VVVEPSGVVVVVWLTDSAEVVVVEVAGWLVLEADG